MSWNIVGDTLAALNQIGQVVAGLMADMVNILLNTITVLLYPLYVGIDIIIYDIGFIYTPAVTFVNIIISIGNIPYNIIVTILVLPPEWLGLLSISIGISLTVRGYRWIKELRGWIPTLSGDK